LFSVREKFPSGMKIFQIPLSWFRSVSAWLNNFSAGTGIKVSVPSAPSGNNPVTVSIDEKYLRAKIAEFSPSPKAPSYTAGDGISIAGSTISVSEGAAAQTTSLEYTNTTEGYTSGDGKGIVDAQGADVQLTLDPTEWDEADDKGFELYAFTRGRPHTGWIGGTYTQLFYRKLTFSPLGRLIRVGPEVGSFLVQTFEANQQ